MSLFDKDDGGIVDGSGRGPLCLTNIHYVKNCFLISWVTRADE